MGRRLWNAGPSSRRGSGDARIHRRAAHTDRRGTSAPLPANRVGTSRDRDSNDVRSARRARMPSSAIIARSCWRAIGPRSHKSSPVNTPGRPWRRLAGQETGVRETFDNPFAILVAGSRVADLEGTRYVPQRAVGFVDDQRGTIRPPVQRGARIVAQRAVAVHRLLDNDHATAKLPQRRVGGQPFPQNP